MRSTSELLSRRIQAAQGQLECDLLLKDVVFLDAFCCEWRHGEIAILDGVIVGIEPGLKAKREIRCANKWLTPGFIDAHVHLESSLLLPTHFQSTVLAKGTTSAICDPHELANVKGVAGIQYFLDSAAQMEMDLWVMLSSCVPATHLETNGGGTLTAHDLKSLASHPRALGLAEMMNVPGVLNRDSDTMNKLLNFHGRPIDGHCPLVKGQSLSAYAASGISSCHESSHLEEAREKLTKGISVWIREGSVAKDLNELAPLLTLATSTSMGFCTDDRNPLDIAREGHIDHLIRQAIVRGVRPEVAYRTASWSVARHYGLTSGFRRYGAIAPGYQADLVLLGDAIQCAVEGVWKAGIDVREISPRLKIPSDLENSVLASTPEASDLEGPSGRVHVIQVLEGKIITGRKVSAHDEAGTMRLSVLERHGKKTRPANGYVQGFGSLQGAIASSVGHDSHNLIVVGHSTEEMKIALACLIESGGGFCVVQNRKVISHLPLPLGGLMSIESSASLTTKLAELKSASREIGCTLHEPFLQLAFLSLPVIPSLKLTDQGLVDVDQFKIIDVRA